MGAPGSPGCRSYGDRGCRCRSPRRYFWCSQIKRAGQAVPGRSTRSAGDGMTGINNAGPAVPLVRGGRRRKLCFVRLKLVICPFPLLLSSPSLWDGVQCSSERRDPQRGVRLIRRGRCHSPHPPHAHSGVGSISSAQHPAQHPASSVAAPLSRGTGSVRPCNARSSHSVQCNTRTDLGVGWEGWERPADPAPLGVQQEPGGPSAPSCLCSSEGWEFAAGGR